MKTFLNRNASLLALALMLSGCATDISDEEAPTDSGLEPALAPGAQLNTLSFIQLPDSRPYQSPFVYGGTVSIAADYRGAGWTLGFAAGTSTSLADAQVIQTEQSLAEELHEISTAWSTDAFTTTINAGSSPLSQDLFTLILNAYVMSENGETRYEAQDAIQVTLDNTPPLARITRICTDAAGSNCFGFTANPADVGASNSATDIYQVSRSSAPKLYVYGIARDKNFTSYQLGMVGGQASSGSYLCSSEGSQNTACAGELASTADGYGWGLTRDLSYQETLSMSNMVDAYSQDALLMVWDISYLSPDAYALNLLTWSKAYVSGDDDPCASSNWITLIINS